MVITLDFETYYAKDFSLTKLSTEEYIRDARFEVIGVGLQIDEDTPVWLSGTHAEMRNQLTKYEWSKASLLCHNTMFDGAILKWIFGIAPKQYLDTLCMARAVIGVDSGGSLASLSTRFGLGEKGTEVLDAIGKHRADFTPEQLEQYGKYCMNDVSLTHKLWLLFSSVFPKEELDLIDMTLRMFINPILEVDETLLTDRLDELKEEKLRLLGSLKERLSCATEEEVRKRLASNKQFAEVLKEFGVTPPTKTSPTTGKETYALAKNDEGFIELTEHEDSFIQELCAVRLGTKSTIEESRIERFIQTGRRNKGRLPIPLKYYGAHTGRWAGSDKVNFQNLPSRDKKKKTLKNAVIAPEGYVVINCDSSQIEARILVWLAGQNDIVEQFRNGEDVYSNFATKVYERPISKADPIERFVGKTCILGLGYGTGAAKLKHTLKTQPPGADVTEIQAKNMVDVYRDTNDKVVKLWAVGDKVIKDQYFWGTGEDATTPYWFGKNKCVKVTKNGIYLPNGLLIRYPNLRKADDDSGKYVYDSRKGEVSIWGGSVVENVVQALARIVVGQQMLKIKERYKVVLTVHDAAVCVVPEDEVEEAEAYIVEVMSTPPHWAKGLPVACEARHAKSYGEC